MGNTPYIEIYPWEKDQYRQGYKDGFEAGKAALRQELKDLLARLPDKQVFTSTASTYTNINH
jgi:hypothetical protein